MDPRKEINTTEVDEEATVLAGAGEAVDEVDSATKADLRLLLDLEGETAIREFPLALRAEARKDVEVRGEVDLGAATTGGPDREALVLLSSTGTRTRAAEGCRMHSLRLEGLRTSTAPLAAKTSSLKR